MHPSLAERSEIVHWTNWFKQGDSPEVFPYRDAKEGVICLSCKALMSEHGLLRQAIICPGDLILTSVVRNPVGEH